MKMFSSGKCQNKRADGEVPYQGRPESCQSGKQVCNVCGLKMDSNGKCTVDSDCKSGKCNKSWWDPRSCTGKCGSSEEEGESDEDNFLEISDDQETGKRLRAA